MHLSACCDACPAGQVHFCAPTVDAREAACAVLQAETGATLVPPYNYGPVISGQGTIAVELLKQVGRGGNEGGTRGPKGATLSSLSSLQRGATFCRHPQCARCTVPTHSSHLQNPGRCA